MKTLLEMVERWTRPVRFLVVEDCEAVPGSLAHLLTLYEAEVVYALTPEEAVQCLAEEKIDAIFVDYGLRRYDAKAILERIKKERKDIPVVVTTEVWDARTLAEVFAYGAVTVLRKPEDYNPQHLREAIGAFKIRVREKAVPEAVALYAGVASSAPALPISIA